MTLVAYSRSFWPLFLHVTGAMVLFGAVLTALAAQLAGHRAAAFRALLAAVPAWVVLRAAGGWIDSDEGHIWKHTTWLTLGQNVADGGVVVLLLAIGAAYWSQRSTARLASLIASALCGVYVLLLVVAWLAMTGKWG